MISDLARVRLCSYVRVVARSIVRVRVYRVLGGHVQRRWQHDHLLRYVHRALWAADKTEYGHARRKRHF